ncbi:hypothetical protein SEPCBS57363_006774 [Sporothrix epigloea]|uniref:Uncharacterized protein n=1 Tax=Sporothrix epigloea TaxID=1892477 RepID=A0ABP0E7X2_9PEZI
MAAQRFIKSAVAKMEHLIKGALKKLEHAVKCAAEQYDRVVESDAKEQDIVTKRANKKPDHAIHGAAKKQDRTKGTVKVHNYAAKDAGKKQVHVIVAAVKEKDLVVQGTVKVHDHVKNDATKEQARVEGAVIKQDCVVKDAVIKQHNAIKSVDEEPDFYESLEEFCRKYSAEAKASRHYKRPGLLTIVEEDETRDGEPIHNFLEIFQKNKYGKPRTLSRLDPPVPLSPISSIASTIPPEPCLLSKCCARMRKSARRNKRKVKRISKRLMKKARQQVCTIRTSSLCGCHKIRGHPSKASPYWASSHSHQSVMHLPMATFSLFQLPPLDF